MPAMASRTEEPNTQLQAVLLSFPQSGSRRSGVFDDYLSRSTMSVGQLLNTRARTARCVAGVTMFRS